MDHQGGRKQQQQTIMANNNSPEVTMASEVFDQFCNANTLKSILGHFRQLCDLLKIKPNTITQFYPKLKAKLRSWKAQALWKKFDQRANHKCYNRGKACPNTRVLIIGGGPCGLRSAIEAQLLGAKVVVVEKRDRMSRNNVLHLWPFVIHDLRGLGAKKFFGKFCAGSIDHISIRQLQCILLKVALILGVEFHESVSFDSLIPPPENQEDGKIGWRAKTTPADHPVSQYEFDVLIGADGKRNTLEGFKRKEFRGKLAIAITANFINKRTEAEARVEEISGVAFIFNQKFFKELYQETGIDLENIVYYKDDTHYFVMTAKKHSLIDKGVILQDHADTAKLLAKENVDREALMLYAREAAEFSTEYQMMDMEFAVNHYGQPDVAMFDFTSMYAAENASRVLERHGHRLLMTLVGDSLLEPFWPTGSGCARGFLSSLDACWAIKGWGASIPPLEVIAERESIYRLLGQTTPENLNRDYAAYTLDPHTRYPNLNVSSVTPIQVRSLLDTDDPESIKQTAEVDIPKKRRRRDLRADSHVHPDTLLRWLQKQVALYDNVTIEDMGASFKDGLAVCAIIHRYRPDLIDFHRLQAEDVAKNNQLAFDILEKELGIPPIMTGEEMAQCDVPDKLAMFSYLTQIYEAFRGEIPHVKHPQLEPDEEERAGNSKQLSQLTADQKAHLIGRLARQDTGTRSRHSRSRHNENLNPLEKKGDTTSRRSRKRRSTEKMGATVEERQRKLAEIERNRVERMKKRQYLQRMATQQFYKSMQMLRANAKREKDEPFEDYSIFLYRQTAPDFKDRVKYLEQKILYPDREPKIHVGHRRASIDEEFSGRIKNIEDKLRGAAPAEKKPRDLLRAIGKIEKTDWNVKEIEKKIEESKMGRGTKHDKVERVPKWSREQFLARQTKMERKGRDQKETDSKYADIDNTLKSIDRKIKEGNVLGYNKVSAMAEQFSSKSQDTEPKVQKSNTKAAIALPAQGGSEMCHFCNKRVYLMERLSAEGKFFHRGCFRCEYCSTSLRIGNHTFDREKNGGRFYCSQHFGFSGTMKARAEKKRITTMNNKENIANVAAGLKTPEKTKSGLEGVVGLDLLDRGQTPERIEFENLAGLSDAEEAQSQMDEDEWTDRNFGASTAEMGSSDDISDMSDSDDNEAYEEAIDQPLTTEGTLELAKNWTLRYSHPNTAAGQSDTGSNEYEDSSDEYTSEDDESGTATEDEEDIRARELRKQEVWLKQPTRSSDTDTGSETEVKISQDSLDKIIENSTGSTPSHSDDDDPNLVSSPVARLDKSEAVVKENVTAAVHPARTFDFGALGTGLDPQIGNDTNSLIGTVESRRESDSCNCVSPVCPHPTSDVVNRPGTSNAMSVPLDRPPACDVSSDSTRCFTPPLRTVSTTDLSRAAPETTARSSRANSCPSLESRGELRAAPSDKISSHFNSGEPILTAEPVEPSNVPSSNVNIVDELILTNGKTVEMKEVEKGEATGKDTQDSSNPTLEDKANVNGKSNVEIPLETFEEESQRSEEHTEKIVESTEKVEINEEKVEKAKTEPETGAVNSDVSLHKVNGVADHSDEQMETHSENDVKQETIDAVQTTDIVGDTTITTAEVPLPNPQETCEVPTEEPEKKLEVDLNHNQEEEQNTLVTDVETTGQNIGVSKSLENIPTEDTRGNFNQDRVRARTSSPLSVSSLDNLSVSSFSRESLSSSTASSLSAAYHSFDNVSTVASSPEKLTRPKTKNKEKRKLKLALKKDTEKVPCPMVTITAASPVQERRQSDELSVESTKLTVPKVTEPSAEQSGGSTSFDKLKQDLKERKQKNRMFVGELKPLSTENAKQKIGKYFEQNKPEKKPVEKAVGKPETEENAAVPKVVQLRIKPKLSNKISAKDLTKYFGEGEKSTEDETKRRNSVQEKQEPPKPKEPTDVKIEKLKLPKSEKTDVLDEEFSKVQQQNEKIHFVYNENWSKLKLRKVIIEDKENPKKITDSSPKTPTNETLTPRSESIKNPKESNPIKQTLTAANSINKETTDTTPTTTMTKEDKQKDNIPKQILAKPTINTTKEAAENGPTKPAVITESPIKKVKVIEREINVEDSLKRGSSRSTGEESVVPTRPERKKTEEVPTAPLRRKSAARAKNPSNLDSVKSSNTEGKMEKKESDSSLSQSSNKSKRDSAKCIIS